MKIWNPFDYVFNAGTWDELPWGNPFDSLGDHPDDDVFLFPRLFLGQDRGIKMRHLRDDRLLAVRCKRQRKHNDGYHPSRTYKKRSFLDSFTL